MFRTTIIASVVAVALSAGLTGCDDKKKEDTKTAAADAKTADAKQPAAAVEGEKPAEPAADAPKDEPAAAGGSPIVGTWAFDPSSMKEMDDYKNAPADQKQAMDAMLGGMKMEMTFTPDSKIKMHAEIAGQAKDTEGKYTVTKTEGDQVTIESEVEGKKESITVTVKDGKLTMEQQGMKMVFTKKA